MVAFGWGLHIFHSLAYVVTLIKLKLLRCHGGNVIIWRWNIKQRTTFFSKWRRRRKLSYVMTKNQTILRMKPRDLRKTVGGPFSFVFRCCWVGRLLTESSIRGDFFLSLSLGTWSHRGSVPVSIQTNLGLYRTRSRHHNLVIFLITNDEYNFKKPIDTGCQDSFAKIYI